MDASDALFGQTKKALLLLFYGKAGESFYVRELVRSVGTGSGAIQREVKNLTDSGLLTKVKRGNRCFYQANKDNRMYDQIRGLMSSASLEQVDGVIGAALLPLKRKIKTAFVFGSVANGSAGPESDVDLMIVGDVAFTDVVPRLAKAESTLHREINPVIYTQSEYKKKLEHGNHFLSTVAKSKRNFLIGQSDDV
jgi:predicted nucleotidyltransferase